MLTYSLKKMIMLMSLVRFKLNFTTIMGMRKHMDKQLDRVISSAIFYNSSAVRVAYLGVVWLFTVKKWIWSPWFQISSESCSWNRSYMKTKEKHHFPSKLKQVPNLLRSLWRTNIFYRVLYKFEGSYLEIFWNFIIHLYSQWRLLLLKLW